MIFKDNEVRPKNQFQGLKVIALGIRALGGDFRGQLFIKPSLAKLFESWNYGTFIS